MIEQQTAHESCDMVPALTPIEARSAENAARVVATVRAVDVDPELGKHANSALRQFSAIVAKFNLITGEHAVGNGHSDATSE